MNWALDNDPELGGPFVAALISLVQGNGGFRIGSANFVGSEAIQNLQAVLREEGFVLSDSGDLRPTALEELSGRELSAALALYARRARQGSTDAALLVGTGKDLVEATAAHVLTERRGTTPTVTNFPTLLGQAYMELGLVFDGKLARTPQERIDAALFDLACAANTLRNKQGTGHGRPFLPTVSPHEARSAVQGMGVVAERLLTRLASG